MAIDSKLRGCDLVRLKVRDVFAAGRCPGARFDHQRAPTSSGRAVQSPHRSTRQYARILRGWVTSIGLDPSSCGTHSMRRTKVAQIYKKTGNLRAVRLLPGHTLD